MTILGNVLAFWNREQLGIELSPGIDEVSLALVADAWSRTYRSRVVSLARSDEPVPSRGGLALLRDRDSAHWPQSRLLPALAQRPAEALDAALGTIAQRYGAATAKVVAMQLEY
jgi:hypothetical protein